MSLALRLGRRGKGSTAPNPFVGCILVKNDRIIGRGYTQKGGRPHAEIVALESSCEDPAGATAYITLEPCCHYGQTPPCTKALVQAGISRVVIATQDPNPEMSGKGIQILKENGITVTFGCLKKEADKDHQGFFQTIQKERPLVTLKLALTIDGKVATKQGESKWITNEQSRRKVHLLRSQSDAILTGSGTTIKDNPTLNQRIIAKKDNPVRFILDSNLSTPIHSRIVETSNNIPTYFLHGKNIDTNKLAVLEQKGVKPVSCPIDKNGKVDLTFTMKTMVKLGITSVFCEGGPLVAASLLEKGFVDRFISFFAGKFFGSEAISSIGLLNLAGVKEAPQFKLEEVFSIDNDVECVWTKITP